MKERIRLNRDWLFAEDTFGEKTPTEKLYAHRIGQLEREHLPPASFAYRPTAPKLYPDLFTVPSWKRVDLPHDYVIAGVPDEREGDAWGFVPYKKAWYLKHFKPEESWRDKHIALFFEGVSGSSVIYVNGCLMHRSFSGYTSFEVDLTDVIRFGERNVIAVSVDPSKHEGWWYEGGGITRGVELQISDPVRIALWGVYVKPVREEGERWRAETETTVENHTYAPVSGTVTQELSDDTGKVFARLSAPFTVPARGKTEVLAAEEKILSPVLWSPESPRRCLCRTVVETEEGFSDTAETKFGFRWFSADPENGFSVNGKRIEIKGLCGHTDCGLFGRAVPDNIHRYRVALMKEMGANAYRASHYMQPEALMEALDEAGFIVYDEARWYESSEEGMRQTEALVRRDRNRPSVFFWGIGNEERHHTTEPGRRVFTALRQKILSLDDTRLITAAVNRPKDCRIFDLCDVIGINYCLDDYETVHERYPDKPILASECCATGTTRGHYAGEDPTRAYLPAWDRDTGTYFLSRASTRKTLAARPYVIGSYQWIAFEHRGEAAWPRLCSQSGAVDLFMQKKDAFYQNRALFSEEPALHLLPHWDWRGMEGREIRVVVYTNCPEVELVLNGRSLGRQTPERFESAVWSVPFEPGTLEAVAYREGKEVLRERRETAGEPYRLVLRQETEDVRANGEDCALVTCYVADREGREVHPAAPTVAFAAEGPCRIVSTGSDISDHTPLTDTARRMRAGRITAAVRLEEGEGERVITASADGLLSACLILKTK
ncbi:MAG: DUF4982 domain-containing protein [Clostridia bacterium]|nr:DUF4982 domain-containing protein [Clostridia bacterium]